MGEGEDDFGGRRWSEFLLPAVRGANDSGSSGGGCNNNVSAGAHGAVSGEDDDSYNGPATSLVLSSTQPSYMRSKTGVEMDPDRFRRRKKMIANLPGAAPAIKRMQNVATNWDPERNGPLLGFDCVSVDPTQFKELFRRNFGVLLKARDLGMLVSMYDKRGEERADTVEFLKDFWQMGREGRETQAKSRAQVVRRLNAKQTTRLKERVERMSRLKRVEVGDHTNSHVQTALAKIAEVATRYDASRDTGFHQLEQGGVMGPTTFREQLRTIFGVRLTRGELGGLVSAFDLHRGGMVDAKEFAFRFHTLGREKHAVKVVEGNARDERARRRKREKEEALMARMEQSSKCKVNWNFTDEDMERGKSIIARAAFTYDKTRLSSDIDRIAQMNMDPTSFRAQLLQNFRVRLGPGELGAIFTYFDKDKSMSIDGAEFMHEFFRLGREERAKRLAETEQQRHRIDKREKGYHRKLEDRFLEQTVAKVIWPTLAHDPFDEDFSVGDDGSSIARRENSTQDSSDIQSIGMEGSVGQSAAGEFGEDRHRRRLGNRTEGRLGEGGGSSAKRSRPKISASTAEFLAHINKEEMAIRALTCRGHRRGQNNQTDSNSDSHIGGRGEISVSPTTHRHVDRPRGVTKRAAAVAAAAAPPAVETTAAAEEAAPSPLLPLASSQQDNRRVSRRRKSSGIITTSSSSSSNCVADGRSEGEKTKQNTKGGDTSTSPTPPDGALARSPPRRSEQRSINSRNLGFDGGGISGAAAVVPWAAEAGEQYSYNATDAHHSSSSSGPSASATASKAAVAVSQEATGKGGGRSTGKYLFADASPSLVPSKDKTGESPPLALGANVPSSSDRAVSEALARSGSRGVETRDSRTSSGGRVLESRGGERTSSSRGLSTRGSAASRGSRGGESRPSSLVEGVESSSWKGLEVSVPGESGGGGAAGAAGAGGEGANENQDVGVEEGPWWN